MWQIPDPAMLRDSTLRAFMDPIRQNLMLLMGQFSNKANDRALTPADLINLGIIGSDETGFYSKVNAIVRNYINEGGSGGGATASAGGAQATALVTARTEVSFTTGSGQPVGVYEAGITLPEGAVILRSWYYVIEALAASTPALLARATLSMGVHTDDPEGIVPVFAADSDVWSVGLHMGMQHKVGPSLPYTNICTAGRDVIYTVGDSAGTSSILTAGRVVFVCEYVVFT